MTGHQSHRRTPKRPPFRRDGVTICPLQDGTEAVTEAEHFDLVRTRTWYRGGRGYVQARVGNKVVRLHRYLWHSVNGVIPEPMEIDHINRDKSDNRLANLRLATPSQNSRNYLRGGASPFPGVTEISYYRRHGRGARWKSAITIHGKSVHLGCFDDEHAAHAAYLAAAEGHGLAEYLPVSGTIVSESSDEASSTVCTTVTEATQLIFPLLAPDDSTFECGTGRKYEYRERRA